MKLSTPVWKHFENHWSFGLLGLSLLFAFWITTEPQFIFKKPTPLKSDLKPIGELRDIKNNVKIQHPGELLWTPTLGNSTPLPEYSKLLTLEASSAFVAVEGLEIEISENSLIELKRSQNQGPPVLSLYRGRIKKRNKKGPPLNIEIRVSKEQTVLAQVSAQSEFELELKPDATDGAKRTVLEVTSGEIKLERKNKEIKVANSQKIEFDTPLSPLPSEQSDSNDKVTITEIPFKLLSPLMDQEVDLNLVSAVQFEWEVLSEKVAEALSATPQVLEISETPDFKKQVLTQVIPGTSPTLRRAQAKLDLSLIKSTTLYWRITAQKERFQSPHFKLRVKSKETPKITPVPVPVPVPTSKPKPSAPSELDEPEIEGLNSQATTQNLIASNDFIPSPETKKIHVKLKWSQVKEAQGYVLEISNDPLFAVDKERFTIPAENFVWETDPSPMDRFFYYRVATQSQDGTLSAFSEAKKFKIPAKILQPLATQANPKPDIVELPTPIQNPTPSQISLHYGLGLKNRAQNSNAADLAEVKQTAPSLGGNTILKVQTAKWSALLLESAQSFDRNVDTPPLTPKTQSKQVIRKWILGGFVPFSAHFGMGGVGLFDSRWVKSASQTVDSQSGSSFGPALKFMKEWNHEHRWAPDRAEWLFALPITGALLKSSFGVESDGWLRWTLFKIGQSSRIELNWTLGLSYFRWNTPQSTSVLYWESALSPGFSYQF